MKIKSHTKNMVLEVVHIFDSCTLCTRAVHGSATAAICPACGAYFIRHSNPDLRSKGEV